MFQPSVDSWLTGVDPAFSKRLGDQGWLGLTWPTRYGGHNRSALERYAVQEELLAAGAPVGAHWIAERQMGPGLLKYGTEDQKLTLVPKIAAGECFIAIGMSEAESGSDLASLRTRATRDTAGNWVVKGRKIWTSNAHVSHYAVTLVRTTPRSHEGSRHDGLSQLIIDLTAPGVTITPIRTMDGEHHFNEVAFDDVVVPGDMLLGREGSGWSQVTAELGLERSGPERFLSNFLLIEAFADATRASEGDQQVAALGKICSELMALRLLSHSVATAIEDGRSVEVLAALVKDLGTTFENDLIDELRASLDVRHLGDRKIGSLFAHAQLRGPGYTLRGGTNEVLRGVIAKGLLNRGGR